MIIPEQPFDISYSGLTNGDTKHTPTVPLCILAEVAMALAKEPDQEIFIHPDYVPYIDGALGDVMLREVLDQHQQRTARDKLAPRFNATVGTTAACYEAEDRFIQALRPSLLATRVFVNESGDPLIFQKNVDKYFHEERSGLTLRDLTIGNITYPSGTLVKVKTADHVTNRAPLTITPYKQIEALGVLRISAFAVHPEDRQPFLTKHNSYGHVPDTTLEDIREGVEIRMQHTQSHLL